MTDQVKDAAKPRNRPASPGRGARETARTLLAQELGIATGCTEPAAIAFAVCAATRAVLRTATERPPQAANRQATGECTHLVRSIAISVDGATYKNTLAVGLPGTELRGPSAAAAIGASLWTGTPSLALLGSATAAHWAVAAALLDRDVITVEPRAVSGLWIDAVVATDEHRATASLQGRHDRLAALTVDGHPRPPGTRESEQPILDDEAIAGELAGPEDLVALAEALAPGDLAEVAAGLERNLALVGDLAEEFEGRPAALVRVATGRRMAGEQRAVATSGGSGNSGLTITLGLWSALGDRGERFLRALALAHFANLAIKARVGRVGPLCGGVIASSTAVGCAIAWHRGGGAAAVDDVIREMVDTFAGTVCDGANRGCAGKIAVALDCAVAAGERASAQPGAYAGDGLGGRSAREALDHLACLAAATGPALDLALVRMLTRTP